MKKKPVSRSRPVAKKRRPAKRPKSRGTVIRAADQWTLRLYIAGQTPRSLAAFANLKRLCEEHLAGRYEIEVVDLLQQPELGAPDQIVALPTLIRRMPEPVRRVIGSLSDLERVRLGIDLFPRQNLAS